MNQIKLSEKQELLDTLNAKIKACKKCSLSATRKHALLYNPSFEPKTIESYIQLKSLLGK